MNEEAIFYHALEKTDITDRIAYLNETCGENTELRRRIEALIRSHEEAGSFLNPSNANDALTLDSKNESPRQQSDSGTMGETAESILTNGTTIRYFGDYEIDHEIARGGMGVVFRAKQVGVNRPVALKMILAGGFAGEKEVQRFYAEAEAAANLDHPNIVPIYEVNEHNCQHYFSMKLIEGSSLDKCLTGYTKDPRKAAELMAIVAGAVHHAHQRGLLHRDLKPANILLDNNGQPHVTDFGLAKKIEGKGGVTQSGTIIGTPEYMSPEQASGQKDLTTATDVYSLGAILFSLLTGRPPFRKDTVLETLKEVVETDPPTPSKLQTNIPLDLETICLKCLQKDPTQRYSSAEQLAEDLRRYLANEPILARPMSRVEKAFRWCKRNPAVASLLLLLVVMLLAGTAISTWFAIKEGKARKDAEIAQDETEKAHKAEKRRADEEQKAKLIAQEAKANFLRQLYLSDLRLAQSDYENNNIIRMRELLRNHGPEREYQKDLRSFEWYYLNRLADPSLMKLGGGGPTEIIKSAAYSPDGKRIITTAFDLKKQRFIVWDATKGVPLRKFAGRKVWTPFWAGAVSNGKDIAIAKQDKTIEVIDAESGKTKFTLKGHTDKINNVVFSPDGQWIATASEDKFVKVWDAKTGKEVVTLPRFRSNVHGLAFDKEGKRLVVASYSPTVKVWNPTTGKDMLTMQGKHSSFVYAVAFSPNGKRIATASDDHTVKVWDATTGEELVTLKGHTERVFNVVFSPDGRHLASGSADKTVRIWDAETGQEKIQFKGPTAWVNSIAYSPDGRHLACCSAGGVMIWNATTNPEALTLKSHSNDVNCVTFTPDGKRFVSAGDDSKLRIWDTTTGAELDSITGPWAQIKTVAFSPEGKRMAVGGSGGLSKEVRIWDANTAEELLILKGHSGPINSVAFSPDGKRIVSGSWDKTVKVWDATTGAEIHTLKGHTHALQCVAFSPDGKRIASGASAYDYSGGKKWLDPESYWGEVKVWEAASGKQIYNLKHGACVKSVAFSPDGKWIVSGSFDKTVKLWDAATGKEIHTLKGHTYSVYCVAFSPDSKRIVSGSRDKTMKLWDVRTGAEILTLMGHQDIVTTVAFNPNGLRIVSGSEDHMVKVWDATSANQKTQSKPNQ